MANANVIDALDAQDMATERLAQARGILDLLTSTGSFAGDDASVASSVWAVQALLAQAHAAVKAMRIKAAA